MDNGGKRAGMAMNGPKRISILGATGSVGRQTLDVVAQSRGAIAVEALVAHRNAAALAQAAIASRARIAVVGDPSAYGALKEALAGTGIEAAAGEPAVLEAAGRPVDLVMSAMVGAAGLHPTLAAIEQGTHVAFANKETLVCAGDLVTAACRRRGVRLIPVDSEHSAIFQVLDRERLDRVERLILTASGGPFRTWTLEQMAAATPAQAVAHPNWSMGAKISVDSATMMNKGLEVIEAHHLFTLMSDQLDVVVHPQSVIHSMVAYVDGSVLAQLGTPDMRTPIAVALAWPDRMPLDVPRLDMRKNMQLTFEPTDTKRFPALDLARRALLEGGAAPALLNAANEVAVAAFLAGRIGFLAIAEVVEATLAHLRPPAPATLDDVTAVDADARRFAEQLIAQGGPSAAPATASRTA
jgi:1-deoxy-D-xylulose-5-phosphate reductoisomerase